MDTNTLTGLKDRARQIRQEREREQNSAERVGSLLEDMLDYDKDQSDMANSLDARVTILEQSGGSGGGTGNTGMQKTYFLNLPHSDTQPDLPELSDYSPYPDDWFDDVAHGNRWTNTNTNPTANQDTWYIWVWFVNDVTPTAISGPVRLKDGSQTGGSNGEDSDEREWIYKRVAAYDTPTIDIWASDLANAKGDITDKTGSKTYRDDDAIPPGWEDRPSGITSSEKYEFVSFRDADIDPVTKKRVWGNTGFTRPILWSNWGEKGMDGDGVEYIYYANNLGYIPTGDILDPTRWTNDENFQNPEYIRTGSAWTDDPIDLSQSGLGQGAIEWVSVRKKQVVTVGGQQVSRWQAYSTPAVWSRLAVDGLVDGYVVDLSNENMPVGTTFDGHAANYTNSCSVNVYHNGALMSYGTDVGEYSISIGTITRSDGTSADDKIYGRITANQDLPSNPNDIIVSINSTGIDDFDSKNAYIPVTVTLHEGQTQNTTRHLMITMFGVAVGEAGKTVDLYTEAPLIHVNKSGTIYPAQGMSIGVKIGTGSDVQLYLLGDGGTGDAKIQEMGLSFFYTIDQGSVQTPITGPLVLENISGLSNHSTLSVIMKKTVGQTTTRIDEEMLHIVKDGTDLIVQTVTRWFSAVDSAHDTYPTQHSAEAEIEAGNTLPSSTAYDNYTVYWQATQANAHWGVDRPLLYYQDRIIYVGGLGEWGPVTPCAVWANDGENTIQVTLDNEHEDFLYSDSQTLPIAPSGGAASQAHLWNGHTEITTNIGWSIVDDDNTKTFGVPDSGPNRPAITGTGLLSVPHITEATAKVTIKAAYPLENGSTTSNTKYYYAAFTANKTSQDKYDLKLVPGAIAFNASDAWSDKTITASVKRTDLQGNVTSASIVTTETDGLRLYYSYVNADGSLDNNSLTRLGSANFTLPMGPANTYIGIYFELRLYTGNTYRMCDYETVEIAKTANGAAAASTNPNILLRTIFDKGIDFVKEAWNADWTYVDIDNNTLVQGRKSLNIDARSTFESKDFVQNVYGRVKESTWYTLSFYSYSTLAWYSYLWPNSDNYACIDRTEWYVDGVHSTSVSINGQVNWPANDSGTRHTITFKTVSSFPSADFLIIFRAMEGGKVEICMPKLEEGSEATAYVPHESDLQGSDAWSFTANPANVIITQSLSDPSSFSTDTVSFFVKKGSTNATVTGVNSLEPSHFSCTLNNNNTVTVTAPNTYIPTGQTEAIYYTEGNFKVTVTATASDGTTSSQQVTVPCYANLLGTWKTTIEGDVESSVANKLWHAIDPNDPSTVRTFTRTGEYIRSASENISNLRELVSKAGETSRNLFGFHKGVDTGGFIPFIQGYGVVSNFVLPQGSSRYYGYIKNLGLGGDGGDITVSFQARADNNTEYSFSFWTYGNDDNYLTQVITTSWVEYELHYNLNLDSSTATEPPSEYALETIAGGEFQISPLGEGDSTRIYVRHLKIERGTEKTAWCEADEDLAYTSKDIALTTVVDAVLTNKLDQNNYTDSAGKTKYAYRLYYTPSDYGDGEWTGGIRLSGNVTLEAGKIYTMSYWAVADADDIKMYSNASVGDGVGTNYDIVNDYQLGWIWNGGSGSIIEEIGHWGDTDIRLSTTWKQYFIHFYVVNTIPANSQASFCVLSIAKDMNADKSGYVAVTDFKFQEGYVVEDGYFESMMSQSARRISLWQQTGLNRAGIDIENGTITATGNRFRWLNNNGDQLLGLNSDGDAELRGELSTMNGRVILKSDILRQGTSAITEEGLVAYGSGSNETVRLCSDQYVGMSQEDIRSGYFNLSAYTNGLLGGNFYVDALQRVMYLRNGGSTIFGVNADGEAYAAGKFKSPVIEGDVFKANSEVYNGNSIDLTGISDAKNIPSIIISTYNPSSNGVVTLFLPQVGLDGQVIMIKKVYGWLIQVYRHDGTFLNKINSDYGCGFAVYHTNQWY